MKVIRARERWRDDVRQPNGRFRGNTRQRLLHETPASSRMSFVSFEPDARTHWHSHSGGQVLHVVEGTAQMQSFGGPLETLEAGDTSITPPDERHWHGAGPEVAMTHLTVTCGEVTWYED